MADTTTTATVAPWDRMRRAEELRLNARMSQREFHVFLRQLLSRPIVTLDNPYTLRSWPEGAQAEELAVTATTTPAPPPAWIDYVADRIEEESRRLAAVRAEREREPQGQLGYRFTTAAAPVYFATDFHLGTLMPTMNQPPVAAASKAEGLLQDTVTEAEYDILEKHKYLPVRGAWWTYHICRRNQTELWDEERMHAKACLQLQSPSSQKLTVNLLLDEKVPDQDRMVGEYLLLKNDEKRYLETANLFWVSHNPPKFHAPGQIQGWL